MPKELDRIRHLALCLLAEKHGDDLIIHHIQQSKPDKCDRTVYRISAGPAREPNNPSLTLVLDAAGNRLDLDDLLRRFGKDLFVPDFAVKVAPLHPADIPVEPSIEPNANTLVLPSGTTLRETITVRIPRLPPSTMLDVYFLADVTGSMQQTLDAVKNSATAILTALRGLGWDFAAGVGSYRDFTGEIPSDPAAVFMPQQTITAVDADIQAAMDTWAAGGGGDLPEGQLYALHRIAADGGGEIGWRPGSRRILVWFGDAPGHEPICQRLTGLARPITTSSVALALDSASISVVAISATTTSGTSLNGDPRIFAGDYAMACTIGGAEGQADIITAETGGLHRLDVTPQEIVDAIIQMVMSVATTMGDVRLNPIDPAGRFVHTVTPLEYSGLPSNEDHELTFTVEFLGNLACDKDRDQVLPGKIAAMVGDFVIAEKDLVVTVPKCDPIVIPPDDDDHMPPPYEATSSPAAAAIGPGRAPSGAIELSVFVAGGNGQLLRAFNTAEPRVANNWRVEDLGRPGGNGGAGVDDAPVALTTTQERVSANFDLIHAFVKGTGSEVHGRSRPPAGWLGWAFEGAPHFTASVPNSPAAVRVRRRFWYDETGLFGIVTDRTFVADSDDLIYLFATATDGLLYRKSEGHWAVHGSPAGVDLVGPPVALRPIAPGNVRVHVFAVGNDGQMHANFSTNDEATAWTWKTFNRPSADLQPIFFRRSAAISFQDGAGHGGHVFVPTVGGLGMLQWQAMVAGQVREGNWTQLGQPAGVGLRGSPSAVALTAGGVRRTYAFMRGSDQQLWVNLRSAGGGAGQWRSLGSPGPTVRGDPSAIVVGGPGDDPIYVFVRGTDDRLHYCFLNATADVFRWNTIVG